MHAPHLFRAHAMYRVGRRFVCDIIVFAVWRLLRIQFVSFSSFVRFESASFAGADSTNEQHERPGRKTITFDGHAYPQTHSKTIY